MESDSSSERWSVALSAFVGGVVSLVLGFVPFSPVLGGALAGYLRRGSRRDGTTVGAAAGLVAALPALVFLVLVPLFFMATGPGTAGAVRMLLVVLVAVGFVALYVVGLSALGGYLGIVAREWWTARRSSSADVDSDPANTDADSSPGAVPEN